MSTHPADVRGGSSKGGEGGKEGHIGGVVLVGEATMTQRCSLLQGATSVVNDTIGSHQSRGRVVSVLVEML